MDNALYVGLSRQVVLQRMLDVAANNIANQDTIGFKVEQLMSHTYPMSPPSSPGVSLATVNYVQDASLARDFSQGEVSQTGNPYDLALQGNGFFTVQTASGPQYTRDGRFTLDAQNEIVDKDGDPVLSAAGSPIVIDPTKGPPLIAKDGTISQTGVNGQLVALGKVAVVQFANLSALTKQGSNLYADNSGQIPTPAANTTLEQGFVEHSNVKAVAEVTNLIQISRAYERMQDLMTSTQDLSSKAIDTLAGTQ